MQELLINSTVQHTLLLFIPLLFAFILKQTRVRGWGMLGGILGGLLLGPTVFGAVAPDYWEGIFQGGTLEHEKVVHLERQQQADLLAAATLGVDETSILQMKADHFFERSELMGDWENAQWKSQRTLRTYAMALVMMILLSGSVRCRARGTAPPAMSLSVGVWAAIIPIGLTTLLLLLLTDMALPAVLGLGACLGAGPWTLAQWERTAADTSEQNGARLMLRCGRVAWIVASILALSVAWQSQGAMALVWLLPLLLLPFVWLVPPKQWKWLQIYVDYAAVPSVMATSLVLIRPLENLQFWPILIVILFCADARWLGGIVGLGLLGGRKSGDAMRLSIPLVDAGVSQLCMACLLIGVGTLPAPFAIAALVGAVFLEFTAPIRLKMSKIDSEPI
jgi:hypothetical protein